MARYISCDEFQTRVDAVIRRMEGELRAIAADLPDAGNAEFTFEDWWDHLSLIAMPETLLAQEVRSSFPEAA